MIKYDPCSMDSEKKVLFLTECCTVCVKKEKQAQYEDRMES